MTAKEACIGAGRNCEISARGGKLREYGMHDRTRGEIKCRGI